MIRKLFGTKEFYASVLTIILPIMTQQLVESLVSLVDNVMLGSIGSIALTSVTIANNCFFLYNSTLFGLCGGVSIFIAQFFGAKEYSKCQQTYNISLILGILFGILFTVVVSLFPELIISLFSKNTNIIQSGLEYFKYIRYSYIPYGISLATLMALRPIGINNIQLKIGIVSVLTNTCLNYILIYGHFGFPQLGIAGAAIATTIARLLEMTIYIIILLRKQHFYKIDLYGMFHLDLKLTGKVLVKAIPLTLNEVLFTLANTLVYKSYMRADEFLVAAISVIDTIINLAFIVTGGLSNAIAVLIGNKLGANEIEVAKENSLKLIVLGEMIAFCSSILLEIIAPYVPLLYNLEPEINATIITLIRIEGLYIPAYFLNCSIFFILRAGGDTKSTLIMDSGYLWAVNVTVSTVLSMFTNISLVMLYAITEGLNYGKSLVAIILYKRGKWAKNITIENPVEE